MKLLIAGDLHGSARYAGELYRVWQAERPDKTVLLGDYLYHGPRNALPDDYDPKQVAELLNKMADNVIAVRGNCDAEVDQVMLAFSILAEQGVLFLNGKTVHITHGHHMENLRPKPGDAVLSGHTHVGLAERRDDILYLNPGSVSLPRDGHHSYMLYENGVFYRRAIDGTVLGQTAF